MQLQQPHSEFQLDIVVWTTFAFFFLFQAKSRSSQSSQHQYESPLEAAVQCVPHHARELIYLEECGKVLLGPKKLRQISSPQFWKTHDGVMGARKYRETMSGECKQESSHLEWLALCAAHTQQHVKKCLDIRFEKGKDRNRGSTHLSDQYLFRDRIN